MAAPTGRSSLRPHEISAAVTMMRNPKLRIVTVFSWASSCAPGPGLGNLLWSHMRGRSIAQLNDGIPIRSGKLIHGKLKPHISLNVVLRDAFSKPV